MRRFIESEFQPGSAVETDEQLLDYARRRGGTVFHPTSTCKMGVDAMAVVDPELRVHGLEGLRVADASIMPTLVSGNTNAATIMIGETRRRHGAAEDEDGGVEPSRPHGRRRIGFPVMVPSEFPQGVEGALSLRRIG